MTEELAEILLDEKTIRMRVAELGAQISHEMSGMDPCMMPIMDGGMIFAADLIREIHLPLTLLPIKTSSYGDSVESSGKVLLPWGIPDSVSGRDILLIDDILDTGHTLATLRSRLFQAGARSIRSCVLLRKLSSGHLSSDYLGFEIPDKFVVGYGLDLAGRYRNLPHIGVPHPTAF